MKRDTTTMGMAQDINYKKYSSYTPYTDYRPYPKAVEEAAAKMNMGNPTPMLKRSASLLTVAQRLVT
jgi:hypothetical protein